MRNPAIGITNVGVNALTRPRRLPNRAPSLSSRVRGKVVLVTGASSGIGRELSMRLADAGAITLVTARRSAELDHVCAAIEQAGGVAHALPADLSDDQGIDALADRVLSEFGAPEVLVNNAGRSIKRSLARSEHRLHDFERAMRVNYLGPVGLTLRLLPEMRHRRSGHVLHSSSIAAQAGLPRFAAYVGSKAALDAFARVAAVECLTDNVVFTTVHLPLVDTEMIGPTNWGGFRPLSVTEATELLVDAVRRRPDHVDVPLGTLAAFGTRTLPTTSRRLLHAFHRMTPDSRSARSDDQE